MAYRQRRVFGMGGTYPSYAAYIRSGEWASRRREALARGLNRCYVCRDSEALLHVHHIDYTRVGMESPTDLVVLCEPCHADAHTLVDLGRAKLATAHHALRRRWLKAHPSGSAAARECPLECDDPTPDADSVISTLLEWWR